ncbi:hypothetical protein MBLNU13_g09211t1 [Cladosporium sp. NU13]
MLGRQVTAALRRPLQARPCTTAAPQTPFALAVRTFTYAPRLLDTAGRPRKAVGEPSRPVKRAVKKAAKKPATPEEEALIAEKKRVAKEKLRKQNAAEKKKAKEAAMTPEELAEKKAKLQRAEISELKKAALKPPFPSQLNAYSVFLGEKGADLKGSFDSSTKTSIEEIKSIMSKHAAKTAAAYKALSAGELEHYNHLARVRREDSAAEFKRWVESHSIAEIKLANNARRALNRKDPKLSRTATRHIQDERLPKKGVTAYLAFSSSRQTSGDFKHIAVTDRSKLIAEEWKALDAEEKEKYEKLAKEDQKRYASEKAAAEA